MITPKWFQLIKAHHDRYGVALTLPFLIGSLRGPQDKSPMSPETATSNVSALLQRFETETPEGYSVRIYLCGDLRGQPVATILSSDQDLPADTLFPDDSASIAIHSERLYHHFAADICAARFSYQRTPQRYEEFTPADLEFIECTLNQ